MNHPSVGIVLITHRARAHLPYCLPPLLHSSVRPRILLINSSSSDGTVELAQQFGIETWVIPRKEFNHGATRELARKRLKTDIVIMTTPDAYATNQDVVTKLIQPIIEEQAACAYARQIPHKGAPFFEAFPRQFNYPETSHIRSIQDVDRWGVYTYFFSDSFGAYLNTALDTIGGFNPVLTGEDTVACAKLLLKGYKVAYVAEAEVHHSHCYSLLQEFKRHFDTGLAREGYKDLLQSKGGDASRGRAYVKQLLKELTQRKRIHLLPYALLQILVKWTGYQIGKRVFTLPFLLRSC